jgi:hypothetical protein
MKIKSSYKKSKKRKQGKLVDKKQLIRFFDQVFVPLYSEDENFAFFLFF